jgi:hypothetical protein
MSEPLVNGAQGCAHSRVDKLRKNFNQGHAMMTMGIAALGACLTQAADVYDFALPRRKKSRSALTVSSLVADLARDPIH